MASSSSSASAQSSTRLYVGNLHFTVDEYALIKIFSRYGKIAKLDFLFHKAGPMKGKPRGYAFVEFGLKEDALKALVNLHDKPLRGRNLVVTYASQNQTADSTSTSSKPRGRYDPTNPSDKRTTLSLVKGQKVPQGASAQIAALEAKLASMKRESQSGSASHAPSGLPSAIGADLPSRPSGDLPPLSRQGQGERMNGEQ